MVFKLEIENYLPKAKRNEAQWWISLHPLIPSHFPLMVEWVSAKLIYFFNPHFSLKNQSFREINFTKIFGKLISRKIITFFK